MQITLEGIHKSYGTTAILHGIDVTFRAGQITALLGPSGSGKTTVLNIVAGLVAPSAGRVLFDARDVTAQPVETRRIGYVFQHHALFPHLTAEGNVAFPLRVRGVRRAERQERARAALAMVELAHLAARPIATLSGGQRQRVALARALVAEPQVLLLDEPLSALDPELRGRIRQELRTLLQPLPLPVVLVTHDQDDAFVLADQVVLLQGGRIAQAGTPEEIYAQPANEAVARFVGVANYLADAQGASVLFRPEDVVPVGLRDAADLVLRVEHVQFLGNRRRLVGRDDAGRIVIADLDKRHQAVAGSTVRLRLLDPKPDPGRSHDEHQARRHADSVA